MLCDSFLVRPFRAIGAKIRVETTREGSSPFQVDVGCGAEDGVFILKFHRDVCREVRVFDLDARERLLLIGVRACVWDPESDGWSRETAQYRYLCGRDEGGSFAVEISIGGGAETVAEAMAAVKPRLARGA